MTTHDELENHTPPPSPQFLAMLALIVAVVWYDVSLMVGHRTNTVIIWSAEFARGAAFAQLALLAVWTAWGPSSAFMRIGSGWLLATIVSIAFVRDGSRVRLDEWQLRFVILALIIWCVVQVPLWVVRVRSRCHFAWHRLGEAQTELQASQFGIAQLLILTAFVAATLALIGYLIPVQFSTPPLYWAATATIGTVLIPVACLIALSSIWAAVSQRNIWLRLALAAVMVVGLTATQSLSFSSVRGVADMLRFLGTVNSIQSVGVLAILLLVQANGIKFRLQS